MSQQFCLKWNNHMYILKEMKHFLSVGIMVDVTLACDGQSLKAHKLVLSACSPFFRSLFLENPCKHPIVILKDIKFSELKAVIDFIYHGEVYVAEDQLASLLKTAQILRVKGLGEDLPRNERCDLSRNEPSSYECGNRSGDNSENQSDDELSNVSVCTVDVSNETFRKRRDPVSSQNDNDNFEPEIKQEVVSDELDLSTSCNKVSCTITRSVLPRSYNSNFFESQQEQLVVQSNDVCAGEENFQDSMQNLAGQSDSFLMQTFKSSPQSNMQQHNNCRDSPSSSITETFTQVSSDTLIDDNQNPGTSSVSPHRNLNKKQDLEKIRAKKSAKNIPSRKPMQQPHNLEESEVISNDESNSREVLEEIKDSRSANNKEELHSCRICPFKSLYLKNVKRHIRNVHTNKTQFQCNKCAYTTASKSQLVYHIESVHQRRKPHHCNFCTYKTANSSNLKRHIASVHREEETFKCEECDFQASEKEMLKEHMITVHEKKKEYACPHCNYRSQKKKCVNGHLSVHKKKKKKCMI